MQRDIGKPGVSSPELAPLADQIKNNIENLWLATVAKHIHSLKNPDYKPSECISEIIIRKDGEIVYQYPDPERTTGLDDKTIEQIMQALPQHSEEELLSQTKSDLAHYKQILLDHTNKKSNPAKSVMGSLRALTDTTLFWEGNLTPSTNTRLTGSTTDLQQDLIDELKKSPLFKRKQDKHQSPQASESTPVIQAKDNSGPAPVKKAEVDSSRHMDDQKTTPRQKGKPAASTNTRSTGGTTDLQQSLADAVKNSPIFKRMQDKHQSPQASESTPVIQAKDNSGPAPVKKAEVDSSRHMDDQKTTPRQKGKPAASTNTRSTGGTTDLQQSLADAVKNSPIFKRMQDKHQSPQASESTPVIQAKDNSGPAPVKKAEVDSSKHMDDQKTTPRQKGKPTASTTGGTTDLQQSLVDEVKNSPIFKRMQDKHQSPQASESTPAIQAKDNSGPAPVKKAEVDSSRHMDDQKTTPRQKGKPTASTTGGTTDLQQSLVDEVKNSPIFKRMQDKHQSPQASESTPVIQAKDNSGPAPVKKAEVDSSRHMDDQKTTPRQKGKPTASTNTRSTRGTTDLRQSLVDALKNNPQFKKAQDKHQSPQASESTPVIQAKDNSGPAPVKKAEVDSSRHMDDRKTTPRQKGKLTPSTNAKSTGGTIDVRDLMDGLKHSPMLEKVQVKSARPSSSNTPPGSSWQEDGDQ